MKIRKTILAGFWVFLVPGLHLQAAVFENFTYTDNGTSITITDYPESATGSVIIPSTIGEKPVTSIGDSAFYLCTGLTNITIPSSVTSIGDYAFNTCSGLTSVTIPSGVASIADGTFGFCTGLTSVTIPSSVTRIGSFAFFGCAGLTGVTIPSSVTSIGERAFRECTGLTGVTIPSSVTTIEYGAFSFCTGLTSVTISPSVTSIEREAFRGCSGLTSVTIPSGVASIELYAFGGCSALTSVTIPSSVTYIGDYAFGGCYGLPSVTIPSSVSYIGSSAFGNCAGLTSVTIPSSVTSIGSLAFSGCPNLSEAIFQGNAPTLDFDVFYQVADSFEIYYYDGRTGFTVPTWYGYPTTLFIARPEIAMQQPDGTYLVDGTSVLAFGNSNIGSPVKMTVTVRNTGTADLIGLAISGTGTNASEFVLEALGATTLAAGESTTFSVTFTPTATGSRDASLHITSNDGDENPFNIALNGTGVVPPAPEISVAQGKGPKKNLKDNKSSRDFGLVKLGKSSNAKVFVIKNDGSAPLTNMNVTLVGKLAKDFRIVKKPAHSVPPGMSTQFKVIYKPVKARTSKVMLKISNNDKDENPFRVELTGNGVK